MARDVLATCDCPECGAGGAEVKRTRAGLLYRWCPECLAQYFPRNQVSSDRLAQRVGLSTGTGTEPEPAAKPAPEPVQERKPATTAPAAIPTAKKSGTWIDALGG